jgi:hypothetical protein
MGICEEADRFIFVWTKKNQGAIIYVPASGLVYAKQRSKVTSAIGKNKKLCLHIPRFLE